MIEAYRRTKNDGPELGSIIQVRLERPLTYAPGALIAIEDAIYEILAILTDGWVRVRLVAF